MRVIVVLIERSFSLGSSVQPGAAPFSDRLGIDTIGRDLFRGQEPLLLVTLVVIRTTRQVGPIKLTAKTSSLSDGSLMIDANAAPPRAELQESR